MSARNTGTSPPTLTALGEGNWIEVGVAVATLGLATLLFVRPYNEAASLWIATAAIAALVTAVVVQDLKTFTIPDGAVVALAILAVASRWAAGDALFAMTTDALLTGGILFLFREVYYRRKGTDGLGFGDVKLATAGGLLVGAVAFAWVLFAASGLALVFCARRLSGGAEDCVPAPNKPRKIAFGAVLAPAILGAWIVGNLSVLLPSIGL